MTYRIDGLAPTTFAGLYGLSEEELAAKGARRVVAAASRGWPCRVTLKDAAEGESLLLFNHVSHDVGTPYRSAYAIYVREGADEAAAYVDAIPPVFEGRALGLRGFDAEGMLRHALLAQPGEADAKIRELFAHDEIATIHAHNAAHGCFAARIERN